VAAAFAAENLALSVDPFGPGIELASRLHNIPFQCLLFIATGDSLKSVWCQQEWDTAQRRFVPCFVLVQDDVQLPASMSARVWVEGLNDNAHCSDMLAELARTARERAEVWGALRLLDANRELVVTRTAASFLEQQANRVAIAEQLAYVQQIYTGELDELVRLTLVRAVYATQDSRAKELLLHWLPVESPTICAEIEQCLTHFPQG
jgi:hypothetical protein